MIQHLMWWNEPDLVWLPYTVPQSDFSVPEFAWTEPLSPNTVF